MRRPLTAAAILVALGLAGPTQAQNAPQAQEAPKLQPQAPQGAPASTANENQKANEALSNPPQAGRTEPSATNAASAHQGSDGGGQANTAPPQPAGPALVNGQLNVNGAPKDIQSVPAKFSERNDRLDHVVPVWPAK
jgi:hypothetical protein